MLQRPGKKSFDFPKSFSNMSSKRFYVDRKIIGIALMLIALVPFILAVVGTLRHWVALPYWDEWFSPGTLLLSYAKGTLSFSDFFYQHNESRKAFPYLLYITLAKIHGWDVRDGMVISLLEAAVICGLLFWLFIRTKGATATTAVVALTLTSFLVFSPVQYDNFLSGLLFELFIPGLATILIALVNLSGLRFGIKTTINAVVALVATYTFANGMLLWILGVPLPAAREPVSRRTRLLWYLIFALVGAAAISAYFIDYKPPPSHPPFGFGILQLAHYMILWVGGYFNSGPVSPFTVGIIVLSLWIVASANAIMLISRGVEWRRFYPWFLISVYALSSGLITAIGRVGFGVEQALSSRYAIFSLFIYLGLLGTTFAVYCYEQEGARPRRRQWIIGATIAVIALAVPTWTSCFHAGQKSVVRIARQNSGLLCALEWMDVFPTNPDLKLILPYPNVLRTRAHVLADAGLLRFHFVSPRFLNQLKGAGSSTDLSHGRLEPADVRENSLIASGWIWSSTKGSDCVLIALRKPTGQLEVLSVVTPVIARPDVERQYGTEKMKAIGFWSRAPIPSLAQGVIEAWAVDTAAETASPLAGAQRVSFHP
jgi:hypothetical protein